MLRTLSLRTRAIVLNVVFAVFAALIGAIGFRSLQNIQSTFTVLVDDVFVADRNLRDLRAEGQAMFSAATELSLLYILNADADEIANEGEEFEESVTALNESLALYATVLDAGEAGDIELVQGVTDATNTLITDSRTYIDAATVTDDLSELSELREDFEDSEQAFKAAVATASDIESAEVIAIRDDLFGRIYRTEVIILVIAVITFLFTIFVGFYYNRRLVSPLLTLSRVADTMAHGDRSVRADENGVGEHGQMAKSFNNMVNTMQQRETDLRELNATLDQRVRERTRDLEAARRIAEDNNRLKSEFLATMSHELRTPLNAIEGFTSIIRNHMGGAEYNDKTKRYIDRIEINSKRLLGLINDFLDISRIESGRQQFAHQPFSPAELAKRWGEEISVLAEKKGLPFEVNIDNGMPEKLFGDEEAISKVALNLLSNAIKFTEVGKVSLALHSTADTWQFVVTDTGIGIPPHAREFIFDEFRQVDQTSKRKFGGTGLGLAIAQKLTRAMGGTITVDSTLGQGSTFTITLPQVLTGTPKTEIEANTAASRSNEHATTTG